MTSRIANAMLITLAATLLCLVGYGLVEFAQPVQAAPVATGKLTPCDAIALAGSIVIFYCEPDNGPSFWVNSVGFMAVEQ